MAEGGELLEDIQAEGQPEEAIFGEAEQEEAAPAPEPEEDNAGDEPEQNEET